MGLEIARSRRVPMENVSADRCGIYGTYLGFVQGAVLRNVHVEQTNHGMEHPRQPEASSSRTVLR